MGQLDSRLNEENKLSAPAGPQPERAWPLPAGEDQSRTVARRSSPVGDGRQETVATGDNLTVVARRPSWTVARDRCQDRRLDHRGPSPGDRRGPSPGDSPGDRRGPSPGDRWSHHGPSPGNPSWTVAWRSILDRRQETSSVDDHCRPVNSSRQVRLQFFNHENSSAAGWRFRHNSYVWQNNNNNNNNNMVVTHQGNRRHETYRLPPRDSSAATTPVVPPPARDLSSATSTRPVVHHLDRTTRLVVHRRGGPVVRHQKTGRPST